jgi:hypothetical protein
MPLKGGWLPKHRSSPNDELSIKLGQLQDAGIDIAGIHQMLGRKQIALRQVRVDGIEQLGIGDGSIRGLHTGDQVRLIRLAGLGQVHLVPGPGRGPLEAEAGLHLVGGLDQHGGWGQVLVAAPTSRPVGGIELLDPDPTQGLQGRNLLQPGGGRPIV